MWITLVACVSTLDAAILIEVTVFHGTQRELLHGLGVFLLPLYLGLGGAWFWIVVQLVAAIRDRRSADWLRVLVLGGLAALPFLM